jgi:hypothetical protein
VARPLANAITLLAVAILASAAIYSLQEKLIFVAEKTPPAYRYAFHGEFVERWIATGDGKVHSLLFKARNARGVILYFHGNAGSLADWGQVGSERQLHEVAKAPWAAAKADYPSAPIVLYGRSIGSGLAVRLASEKDPAALILESPYSSLRALARIYYPWAPSLLLKYTLVSNEWLPAVKCPTLVLYGTDDELIPISQGLTLTKLAKLATFAEIPGGHHNDLASFDTGTLSCHGSICAEAIG